MCTGVVVQQVGQRDEKRERAVQGSDSLPTNAYLSVLQTIMTVFKNNTGGTRGEQQVLQTLCSPVFRFSPLIFLFIRS